MIEELAAADRALRAEEEGDLKAAAKEWGAFAVAYANPTVSAANPSYIGYAALTYEKTGQSAKADAALNAVGKLTLVDCYRLKGDVLDLRGDWLGAQAWYANAVKLGPSIPSGYYSWGVALGLAARLPFPVHPHMLRHACGFKLANDGRDTRALQHYLGHKNIQHTVRYTELSPERFKTFWKD